MSTSHTCGMDLTPRGHYDGGIVIHQGERDG